MKMELFYRRPSKAARNAMSKAALNLKHASRGRYEETALAEDAVKKLCGHETVQIVNSGNSAILAVMSTIKKKVMLPDQGAWTGFKKMAEFLGIEVAYLPTNLGIIDLEELEDRIKKFEPEAIFLTSFAGYTAEQPLKDIYSVCDDNEVILVEDASGGIGDPQKRLGNSKYAHIILASTGSPKTVNIGNGGFISTDISEIFDSASYIMKVLKADPVTCAGIATEIKNAPQIFEKTCKFCTQLKSDILEFRDVIHPEKRGLNIIIPDINPKIFGREITQKLNVHGGGIVTICPNYNRIKSKAVCIEIKNLDINCLTSSNRNELLNIINL